MDGWVARENKCREVWMVGRCHKTSVPSLTNYSRPQSSSNNTTNKESHIEETYHPPSSFCQDDSGFALTMLQYVLRWRIFHINARWKVMWPWRLDKWLGAFRVFSFLAAAAVSGGSNNHQWADCHSWDPFKGFLDIGSQISPSPSISVSETHFHSAPIICLNC